jgi:hypothetical protein
MAKCTRKLIDAEAAVSVAMAALVDTFIERKWTDADDYRFNASVAVARALDALPDANNEINKLRNLLISTYHTLGAYRMLSNAETWNDVADQLRTEIGKTIFPKEDYISKNTLTH